MAELRNGKKITQYELADQLKYSRAQIANYEQGKREPDFKTLVNLADYFEVSLDYLLGRTENPNMLDHYVFHNIAFFGEQKEPLTEVEAEYLKENLSTFRKFNAK
jgi:transcriptional regulator with XRE-family HTH domain